MTAHRELVCNMITHRELVCNACCDYNKKRAIFLGVMWNSVVPNITNKYSNSMDIIGLL